VDAREVLLEDVALDEIGRCDGSNGGRWRGEIFAVVLCCCRGFVGGVVVAV